MSRLAEAFRKASGVGSGGTAPPEWQTIRDTGSASPAPPGVPWTFSERQAQDSDVRPPDTATYPEIVAARNPALGDLGGISSDEVTALARRLYDPGTGESRRRTVLFSAVGREGLSARLSAAVAVVMASQTTASVCLVEGNLRSSALRELFGLSAGRGLSEVLLENGEVRPVLARVATNFWLLPAGSRGADALQCLSAERLRPPFQELADMFDYLVVDTAAAHMHRDAVVLAPIVDGVVLVVAANGTRRETARKTVEHLQDAGAKVLGAVLTDRTFPIPEAIYRKL